MIALWVAYVKFKLRHCLNCASFVFFYLFSVCARLSRLSHVCDLDFMKVIHIYRFEMCKRQTNSRKYCPPLAAPAKYLHVVKQVWSSAWGARQ